MLSLNEFWASVGSRALPGRAVDGAEFWRLVADPHPAFDSMVRSGMPIPEFLHPRAARRGEEGAGIPALSLMALPHLTDDPDGLLEELKGTVTTWPRRTAPEHHAELFDVLCARFGRAAVVERSGYSGHRVPQLHAAFPGAKFVHMFRDGPDCALSMSRHAGFRLILLQREILARTGAAPAGPLTGEQVRSLPPELAGLLDVPFDPALVLDRHLPLAEFGALWSQLVTEAVDHLSRLPQEQWVSLAYEDLLDAPRRELSRIAAFFGVEPLPQWLDTGCAMLDARHRGTALRLPPGELATLRQQCAPGVQALKASG